MIIKKWNNWLLENEAGDNLKKDILEIKDKINKLEQSKQPLQVKKSDLETKIRKSEKDNDNINSIINVKTFTVQKQIHDIDNKIYGLENEKSKKQANLDKIESTEAQNKENNTEK